MGKFKNSCCKNKTRDYLYEHKTRQSISVTGYCRDSLPVAAMYGKMNIMYGQEYSVVDQCRAQRLSSEACLKFVFIAYCCKLHAASE
jgi:hypothetical protein